MKKILVFAALFLVIPTFAHALAVGMPFGGRIILIHTPENVACSSDLEASPFKIMPVGAAASGPWSKMYGQVNIGLVTTTAWILGKYKPSEDCMAVEPPAEPTIYPTMQTNFYGTSIPKGK